MKSKENVVSLVIVCDNHLVVMLAALLSSIEKSHKGGSLINVYLVNDGISRKNTDKLNKIISSDNIRLIWKTIKEVIPLDAQLPKDKSSYPLCIYVRLFMDKFLPQDVDKVIYIDVDTVVIKDIESLWSINIGSHIVAAVTDRAEKISCSWNGIKNYKELGLDPETRYFNTGVLVVNLQKWREMDMTKLILGVVSDNGDFADYPDQYGFNVVFANNSFVLDPRWNAFAENADSDPFLIHFSGLKPIFKGYNFNQKYKEIFYSLLESTPWRDFKPKGDYVSRRKKIFNMISKSSWDVIAKKGIGFIVSKLIPSK